MSEPDDSELEFTSPDDEPASGGDEEGGLLNVEQEADAEVESEDGKDEFELDEDGELVLDENGDPVLKEKEAVADDELEDIEHDGKTDKLPKALKPALMMQADYTRKTQEVAEVRRALEGEAVRIQTARQTLDQQAGVIADNFKEFAELSALDDQIKQYSNIDWHAYEAQDPLAAGTHWRQYQQLKETHGRLEAKAKQVIAQSDQRREQEVQQHRQAQHAEFEKNRRESAKILAVEIPNWGDELVKDLEKYAESVGFTKAEMGAWNDARVIKLVHKAWKADQLVARQKAAKTQKPEQVTPLTRVSKGKSAPIKAGLSDTLSAEEWARRRNEQLRSRR